MIEDELEDELLNPSGSNRPRLTAEQLRSLAAHIVERVRVNPSGLTEPGVVAAVSAMIAEAVGGLSFPNEQLSGWTRRKPTKPGWYWVKRPAIGVELVHVDYSGTEPRAIYASGIGYVSNIVGMWQGPIDPPV